MKFILLTGIKVRMSTISECQQLLAFSHSLMSKLGFDELNYSDIHVPFKGLGSPIGFFSPILCQKFKHNLQSYQLVFFLLFVPMCSKYLKELTPKGMKGSVFASNNEVLTQNRRIL